MRGSVRLGMRMFYLRLKEKVKSGNFLTWLRVITAKTMNVV